MQAAEQPSVARAAQDLVAEAERQGLVLTIEQRPVVPLRMGRYETVVSVRPARAPARRGELLTEDPDHG